MGNEAKILSVDCAHPGEVRTDYWLTIGDESGDATLCEKCVAELRLAVQIAVARGEPFPFIWEADGLGVGIGGGGHDWRGVHTYVTTRGLEVLLEDEDGGTVVVHGGGRR